MKFSFTKVWWYSNLNLFVWCAFSIPNLSLSQEVAHYKLNYFPIRYAGENPRQIFAYAGQEFEDNRISEDDWPKIKPTMPFAQMPVLEVDGKVLAQSHAISRSLAKKFGINGKDEWEEAQVNAIADQFKDYRTEIYKYFLVFAKYEDGDLEKLRNEMFIPTFKRHYGYFSKILKKNGTGYLVGNGLTWIDLMIAEDVSDVQKRDPNVLAGFLEFLEHQKNIHSIENIKKWIEKRPKTDF